MITVRRLLLAALVLGIGGTGTELLLINHVEAWAQLIPVVLLALALPALVWQIAAPRETPVQVFQVTMVLFIAAGLMGLVFHYQQGRFSQWIRAERRRAF